jgi:hypothetical protein
MTAPELTHVRAGALGPDERRGRSPVMTYAPKAPLTQCLTMSDNRSMPKVTSELRDEKVTIRMPSSLLAAIKREAERDRRSVADVMIFALEERFAKRTRKGGK